MKYLQKAMFQEYRDFIKWLGSHTLTADMIREREPELYQNLISSVEALDKCYYREDYQSFTDAMQKSKNLYLDALTLKYKKNGI